MRRGLRDMLVGKDGTLGRIERAVAAIAVVIGIGTAGYTLIEGWSVWQSFYFTLVTITTVGYGDYGLSVSGQVFTVLIFVLGIGTVTYAAGQLLRELIELQTNWERRMERQIGHLQDHFIVCGLGRMGRGLCTELEMAGVVFVVLESNRSIAEDAVRRGWLTVVGDATEEDTLRRANIKHASGLACLTSSDPDNTVITLAARELRDDMLIIGRGESDGSVRRLTRAGATHVISPVRAGGKTIARMIAQPQLASLLDGSAESSCGVRLAEVQIADGSPFEGRSVGEFKEDHREVVIVSLRRAGSEETLQPTKESLIHTGDVLIAASNVDALGRFAVASLPEKRAA